MLAEKLADVVRLEVERLHGGSEMLIEDILERLFPVVAPQELDQTDQVMAGLHVTLPAWRNSATILDTVSLLCCSCRLRSRLERIWQDGIS